MRIAREIAGTLLAMLGLGIVLMELGRYWTLNHPIHPWPVMIGGSIALFGAYVLDPKTTRGGGNLLLGFARKGARIVVFWKTGRRSTDITATVVEPPPPKE